MILVNGWRRARGLADASAEEMPALGYMAYLEEKAGDDLPIACAFLRKVEGGWGLLEGLCTNPEATPSIRNFTIDLLVKTIIHRAQKYRMTQLLSWSVDSGTLERSKAHGFIPVEFSLIAKRLSPL